MNLLISDIPAVDVVDATRIARGTARAVADASRHLLVSFNGASGAFGIAVGCERGESEKEGSSGGGELHGGNYSWWLRNVVELIFGC